MHVGSYLWPRVVLIPITTIHIGDVSLRISGGWVVLPILWLLTYNGNDLFLH